MNKSKKILVSFLIIILIIVLIIGAFLIGLKTGNKNSQLEKTEKAEPSYKYIAYYIDGTENNNGLLNIRTLFTFENNKCINCRISWEFATEEIATEQYSKWKEVEENKNLKINSTIVSFDATSFIGETMEEAITNGFDHQNYTSKIEIF